MAPHAVNVRSSFGPRAPGCRRDRVVGPRLGGIRGNSRSWDDPAGPRHRRAQRPLRRGRHRARRARVACARRRPPWARALGRRPWRHPAFRGAAGRPATRLRRTRGRARPEAAAARPQHGWRHRGTRGDRRMGRTEGADPLLARAEASRHPRPARRLRGSASGSSRPRVPSGLPADAISHDPQMVAAYRADPQVHDRITARLYDAITRDGVAALRQAPGLTTPTLLLVAGADRIADPDGAREFVSALPPAVGTLHWYDGLYHELFNESEPDRSRVIAEMCEWAGTTRRADPLGEQRRRLLDAELARGGAGRGGPGAHVAAALYRDVRYRLLTGPLHLARNGTPFPQRAAVSCDGRRGCGGSAPPAAAPERRRIPRRTRRSARRGGGGSRCLRFRRLCWVAGMPSSSPSCTPRPTMWLTTRSSSATCSVIS